MSMWCGGYSAIEQDNGIDIAARHGAVRASLVSANLGGKWSW